MEFISTRGISKAKNASEAIVKGIAEDGGLFVPATFPDFSDKLDKMLTMTYDEKSAYILSSFLEEYDYKSLENATKNAYGKFDGEPAPVVKIGDNRYILELFHGPTLAFKDIALTLLPYLLRAGSDNTGVKDDILILVATSGDTGKAALEGFKNAKGVKIMVFYPSEGVSEMQKKQMQTTTGDNVCVIGVKGNFDDCQTAVKKIFTDNEFKKKLKENGVIFSSANSMNFGRLCPQIVYYFSSYLDLVNSGEIKLGDKINFVVPTGNFGDILAGFYAYKMGLPVNKLICASNKNNVLTDFFTKGVYDIRREFYKTTSPSMDILISSNLERLIFEITGRSSEKTLEKMNALKNSGVYEIDKSSVKTLSEKFFAGYSDEEDVEDVIADYFDEYGYLPDTHTAVALGVLEQYEANNPKDKCKTVVLSTASAYKFPSDVLYAVTGEKVADTEKACSILEEISAVPVPEQIRALKKMKVRFTKTANREDLKKEVENFALNRE